MTFLAITLGSFFFVLATLLPIINPLYATPAFWTMTAGASKEVRRVLARKIGIYSFFVLFFSALLGNIVLRMLGISIPIVQLGGGLIVVNAGWKLLSSEDPDSGASDADDLSSSYTLEKAKANSFYPLTFPITAGPGSIAAAITVGASLGTSSNGYELFSLLGIILGCMTIGFILYLSNRFAVTIMAKISQTAMNVMMRLVAFLLICIGIQIMWDGLFDLLMTLKQTGVA